MSRTLVLGARRRGRSSIVVASSISIELSAVSRTVTQNDTTPLTVTLTRINGYTGTVTIAASGLPTGVKATYSDATLTGAENTCIVTIAAAVDAPPITGTSFTISATGTGVSAGATCILNVQAPSGTASEPFFQDNFAGGQYNNANGFVWAFPAFTTDFGFFVDHGRSRQVSFAEDVPGSGDWHLRFTYHVPGDPNGGTPMTYDNAELYYKLGRLCPKLWIEWEIEPPADLTIHSQCKFLSMFRDDYGYVLGQFRVVLDHWKIRTPSPDATSSKVRMTRPALLDGSYMQHFEPESERATLMSPTGPVILGQKNQMRVKLLCSSAEGVADGYLGLWANGELVREHTNQVFWNSNTTDWKDIGIKLGYFFGAANGFGAVNTTFKMHYAKFWDTQPAWDV